MAKRPKGQGKGALTPAELAALDFVIKDMEEQGETNLQLGFFWAAIARAALRALIRYLLQKLLDRLRGQLPVGGMSISEMREAEKMVSGISETASLQDLKKLREQLISPKSK